MQASTTLNPDPTAPAIIDPDNPAIANPAIANAEVYNPAIANPAIANPAIANPAIANPAIANPAIANPAIANPAIVAALNPAIANPAIANPAIANPAIANPAIANQTVTDASYTVVNNGNTVGSYAIKLFGTQPAGTSLQLILSKLYATPSSQNCQLTPQVQNIVLVSVPDPVIESAAQLGDPELPNSSSKNATLNLRPGETGIVTLRANVGSAAALQDILDNITPVVVSHAINTGGGAPPATLAITTSNGPLPAGISGVTYTATLSSFGGNAPITWAVVTGALPPGLTLDSLTGIISGTPTALGSFSFSVSLTDTSAPTPSVAFRNLSITIVQPLAITTTSLADGVVGFPYTQTLAATGGDANYSWSLSSGSLPAGLSLSTSGVISGTPTTVTAGTSFTVQVQDTGTPQQTATQLLSIRIAAPLVVATAPTLPDAIVGVPYSATLQTNGGTAPVSWLITSGAPPAGLQLSPSGVLSGTPTAPSPATTFTCASAGFRFSQSDNQHCPVSACGRPAFCWYAHASRWDYRRSIPADAHGFRRNRERLMVRCFRRFAAGTYAFNCRRNQRNTYHGKYPGFNIHRAGHGFRITGAVRSANSYFAHRCAAGHYHGQLARSKIQCRLHANTCGERRNFSVRLVARFRLGSVANRDQFEPGGSAERNSHSHRHILIYGPGGR